MTFSIILPCYNVSLYIQKCLDTIFANDVSTSEIIIIDDGSTDDTLEKCKKYFKIVGGGG